MKVNSVQGAVYFCLKTLVLLLACLTATFSVSAQSLINVDFGAGASGSQEAGFAATGQSSNDFWNFYSRDGQGGWLSFGGIDNLKFADGTASGAGLTIANAPGAWGLGVADPMYNSYLYPFDGGNITIVVSNLPAGAYDTYLYGHGAAQNQNSIFQLSSGGVNQGTKATTTIGSAWQTANWQEGQQYVVFRSVAVNGQIVITVLSDAAGYAIISGLQLAQTGATAGAPPVINNQPVDQTAVVGTNANFQVSASGTAPLSYQWYGPAGLIGNATNPVLTLSNVQPANAGAYWVSVGNSFGVTNSSNAVLTVTQPVSGNTNGLVTLINVDFGAGASASGEVGFAATGQSSNDFWNFYSRDGQGGWMSFGGIQHLKNADGTDSGAGLTIANAPGAWGNRVADPMYNGYLYPFNGGNITVVVSNLPAGAYDIYLYGHGDAQGQNSIFQVSSDGADQGTQSTASTGSAWQTANWQEGQQYVVFRNVTVNNGSVVITVLPDPAGYAIISGLQLAQSVATEGAAPVITRQPADKTVVVGANVSFTVGASGTAPLSYQWYDSAGLIDGATNPVLTLSNAQPSSAGAYWVSVSNSLGATNSSNAVLTVLTIGSHPSAMLLNVNFTADKNPGLSDTKIGFAATGNTTNDYWNLCSRDGATQYDFLSYVALTNLSTAEGQTSGVGLSLSNAPGAWGNGVADPMYNVYLYPFDGGNLTVVMTNLPVGTYDIYVYGHGSDQNGTLQNMNGVYQLSSGGTDYGTQSTATNGTGWSSTDWQEGQQYVVFRGVTVSSVNQPVVLTGLPGASGEAIIAGLQISRLLPSPPPVPPLPFSVRLTATAKPVINLFRNAAGRFSVAFTGQIGMGYRIEYAADPLAGPWTPLTTGTLIEPSATFEDAASTTAPQRFYRVVMFPLD